MMAYIDRIRRDILQVPMRSRLRARGYKPLYVGGHFTNLGGVSRSRIGMTWDGHNWETMGDGLQSASNNVIRAATVLPHPNRLLVGGNTGLVGMEPDPDVPEWDGHSWTPTYDPDSTMWVTNIFSMQPCLLETGVPNEKAWIVVALAGTVHGVNQVWGYGGGGIGGWHYMGSVYQAACLHQFGGSIYVGGAANVKISSWTWDGPNWWDGHWEFSSSPAPMGQGNVDALIDYKGWLIAAGSFWKHEDYYRIAKKDPVTDEWHPLGSNWETSGFTGNVRALTRWRDYLVAGGDMGTTIAGQTVGKVALWTGGAWMVIGQAADIGDGFVESLTTWNNALIVGGRFHQDNPASAGVIAYPNPDAEMYAMNKGTWLQQSYEGYEEDVWVVTTRPTLL